MNASGPHVKRACAVLLLFVAGAWDHVNERIKPQKGITSFVSGAGGQLRKGDVRRSDLTAAQFD